MVSPDAPNTIRLVIPEPRRAEVGLHFVQKTVFEDLLGMARESIFCVQCFPSSGFYDVTFWTKADMQTCWMRQAEKAEDPVLEGLTFLCSETKQRIPLMVHMYNPFAREDEIRTFLLLYCDFVSAGAKQTNIFGTFNGHRKFWVQFKRDLAGIGGVRHPPQAFSIGPNRGYLWYPGQPVFCRLCFSFGHSKENCQAGQVCRNCFKTTHTTAECHEGRKCHLCGSGEHLARACPEVSRTRGAGNMAGQDRSAKEENPQPRGKASYAEVVGGSKQHGDPREAPGQPPGAPAGDEQQAPEPDLVPDEAGVSRVSSDGGVPETLAAEGEQRVEKDGESGPIVAVENPEEDMDLSQGSLKRKVESSGSLSPSKDIREFPSGKAPSQADPAVDSDSSVESFASEGRVESLQAVMGYQKCKKEGGKLKSSMKGVNVEEAQRPKRVARGRWKEVSKKK